MATIACKGCGEEIRADVDLCLSCSIMECEQVPGDGLVTREEMFRLRSRLREAAYRVSSDA